MSFICVLLVQILFVKSDQIKNYIDSIYYNNTEVRLISLDSLFEIVSFAKQNVFVFDDSIIIYYYVFKCG